MAVDRLEDFYDKGPVRISVEGVIPEVQGG
jgi:hypothetical protein